MNALSDHACLTESLRPFPDINDGRGLRGKVLLYVHLTQPWRPKKQRQDGAGDGDQG